MIVPAKDWRVRQISRNSIPMPVKYVYVHHTADNKDVSTYSAQVRAMRGWEAYHMDARGYDGGIAYSFVVMPDGTIFEGRGWGAFGAHTLGQNDVSHAWCFAGTFSSKQPTRAALEAAATHIRWGMERGYIRAGAPILGHREAPGNSTSCPGDRFMSHSLPVLQSLIEQEEEVTEADRKAIVAGVVQALTPVIKREVQWVYVVQTKMLRGEPSSLDPNHEDEDAVRTYSNKAILDALRAGGIDPALLEAACERAVRRVLADAGAA